MADALIHDTFTAADGTLLTAHTGDSGVTWSSRGGAYTIASNRAWCSTLGLMAADDLPGVPNYDIEAVIRHINNAGHAGLVGRLDAGTDTYYLFQTDGAGTAYQLLKCANGSFTTLDTGPISLGTPPADYTLRLSLRDGAQLGYLNGVLVAEASDTTITASGLVGIRSGGMMSSTTGKHIDSFAVTAYSDPPVVDAGGNATAFTSQPWTQAGSFTDSDTASGHTATVDYGDGGGAVPLTLSGQTFTLSHTYSATGTYPVTVTVDDGEGGVGTDTMQVTVADAPTLGTYITSTIVGTDASAPVVVLA